MSTRNTVQFVLGPTQSTILHATITIVLGLYITLWRWFYKLCCHYIIYWLVHTHANDISKTGELNVPDARSIIKNSSQNVFFHCQNSETEPFKQHRWIEHVLNYNSSYGNFLPKLIRCGLMLYLVLEPKTNPTAPFRNKSTIGDK